MQELEITRAIADRYFEKFRACAQSDCLIAGAGPSGMLAAHDLARAGRSVVVLEKRLSPGGGVWGGGMTWNEVAVQEEAKGILDELGVRAREAGTGPGASTRPTDSPAPTGAGLYTADSLELAATLCTAALQAGATILNMTFAEDITVEGGRVTGLVVNRSGLAEGRLPIDPLGFSARTVLDATGHEAALATFAVRHGLKLQTPTGGLMGEGAMEAQGGERFVVERAGEAFPGLYVCGMAVCAVWGGPRMGPIFGGMLMSGRRIAGELEKALG